MRIPKIESVISEKKIWELCIDFISTIDKELVEYNLVLAYINYLLAREAKFSEKDINRMVFISCFQDIGRLNAKERNSSSEIETYLFLKYFSPMEKFVKTVLYDELNKYSYLFYFAKKYTSLLIEKNNPQEAFNALERSNYSSNVYKLLDNVLKKKDIKEELNSMHYKCIIYTLIQKILFKREESTKFITMLSSLFEMYSKQTLFHSTSCAEIAYFIAIKMKRPSEDAKKIYLSGLVHDLGKVRVPKSILEKDSKLNDDEFIQMKKHVIYTRKLLKHHLDFDIVEMASRHHEKLDGSGYPMHLDSDHMTLNQKIIQVSDIVSALTLKRSYKAAWSIEDVVKELKNMASKNLIDKDICKVVEKYNKQILKITQNLQKDAESVFAKIEVERNNLTKESRNAIF